MIMTKVVPNVSEENHKRILTQGDMEYHYKVSGDYIYVVICKNNAGRQLVWNLIDDIENYVLRNGTSRLGSFLEEKMNYYNDSSNDKIQLLKRRVDEVRDVMIDNIDKILERGERLEDMVSKTEELAEDANNYRTRTRKVKNRMIMRYVMMAVAVFFVILAIIIIIVMIACKFPSFSRCRSN
jgi:hypothetical protein